MVAGVTVLWLAGIAVFAILGFAVVFDGIDRAFTKLCLVGLRDAVEGTGRKREKRSRALQSIHATSTYPVYASKSIGYAGLVAVGSSFLGTALTVHAVVALLAANEAIYGAVPSALHFLLPPTVTGLDLVQWFVVFLVASATFGLAGGLGTYSFRWWLIRARSEQRRILIDESVARTIAFIYALSRSGMVFPQIMRTVGRNRRAFGESAEEIGVVVKDMDLFGADLVTALERIAQRTPSDQFGDFAENFANALQSGGEVSTYLREQYEQYQQERIANQERLLELFTAIGEGYVAILVAGPLFLITILLIFGILTGGLLDVLRALIYAVIPIANLGFIGYVGSISEPLSSYQAPIERGTTRRSLSFRRRDDDFGRADGGTTRAEPDEEMNRIRLAAYNRISRVYRELVNPVETVLAKPSRLLVLTVPIAVLVAAGRLWLLDDTGALSVRTADDVLLQSTLFVAATYAVVQAGKSRRLREIEAAVPDFLERLANTNEAGMTFTESLRRIDRKDLGVLNVEVERLLADINWGARTETALLRFNERIGSSTVARVVALLTNAMSASGNLAPVLRIAADEAREDERLRRSRRQELFLYVVIIYLAFFIFLGIGVALQAILVPAIPSAAEIGSLAPSAGDVGVNLPINPVQGTKKAEYTLLLFHAALIQAVFSGFVAGQMGEGSLADGAKHVAVMLFAAYGVFLIVG